MRNHVLPHDRERLSAVAFQHVACNRPAHAHIAGGGGQSDILLKPKRNRIIRARKAFQVIECNTWIAQARKRAGIDANWRSLLKTGFGCICPHHDQVDDGHRQHKGRHDEDGAKLPHAITPGLYTSTTYDVVCDKAGSATPNTSERKPSPNSVGWNSSVAENST